MLHYPFIKVSGATYYEIGKDYGRQAKDLIAHAVSDYKQVFAGSSDRSWEEIQQFALSFVDITRRVAPEVMEEVEASPRVRAFHWRTSWWLTADMKLPNSPRKMSAPRLRCCPRLQKTARCTW